MGWGTRRSVEGGRVVYSRQRLELGSCGAGDQRTGSMQFGAFIGRSGETGKLEGSPRLPRPLAPSPSLQAFRRSNPIPCDPRPPTSWTVHRLWSVLHIIIICIILYVYIYIASALPPRSLLYRTDTAPVSDHPPDRLPMPARFHVQPRTNYHTPRFTERISSRSRPHTRSPFVHANELPSAPPLFALPPPSIDVFLFSQYLDIRSSQSSRHRISMRSHPSSSHLHLPPRGRLSLAFPNRPSSRIRPATLSHMNSPPGLNRNLSPHFSSSRTLGTTPNRQVVYSSSLALFVLLVPFWESRFLDRHVPSFPSALGLCT